MKTDNQNIDVFLLDAIRSAGKSILGFYGSRHLIEHKDDRSPVTEADLCSHEIITDFLRKHYSFPVLSEEGMHIPYEERRQWDIFWMIDPLDGTKEFISGNGEFTVNVACIKDTIPVIGVIYAPPKDVLYYAVRGEGAYKIENRAMSRLRCPPRGKGFTVVGSRSHRTEAFDIFISKLRESNQDLSFISAGSSLKFCLVAEGKADIYPRFGPTMEWDTAAGQVILEEAGGMVVQAESRNMLLYNKPDLRNPAFIATGRSTYENT